MRRLLKAERILTNKETIGYLRKISDFPAYPLSNIWTDTLGQAQFGGKKLYAVQTALKVIARCMLMTTIPGDLVIDPTCGSGTTSYIAEQWGRRWITIDSSRVAIAIARQRVLTAKFDYYQLKDENKGIESGFICKKVPHIMPSSITQNTNLDPIFARHEPVLEARLADLNAALAQIGDDLRRKLAGKLLTKQKTEGKRAITDADTRMWQLPGKGQSLRTLDGSLRYRPRLSRGFG